MLRPQGLVALTGLRTLGFGRIAPIGALSAEYEEARLALLCPQGLVALTGLRTLGSGWIAPLGLACPLVGSPSGHLHLDLPRQAGACVAVRRQLVWRVLLACRISLFASLPCACLSFMALSPYRGDPIQSPGCVALQGRPNPGLFG